MEVKFYCRESKKNSQGYSPIEVSVALNGKRGFINLDRKERPETFQREMSKRKSDLREYTEAYRALINKALTEIVKDGEYVTIPTLREYLRGGGKKNRTIDDVWGEYINILKKRIGRSITASSVEKYINVEKKFNKFINSNLPITSVTNKVVTEFYYTLQQEYKEGTSGGMMTKLKTVIQYAIDNGYLQINPFSALRISKGKPTIEYLTEDEIMSLRGLKTGIERIDNVRDLCLFQMSTGLSYIDMATLKKSDMKEENGHYYISSRRQKTGVEYCTVVLPEGIKIWEKYKGKLPILSNQRYNSYLKEIQDLCRIKKNLHSHIFRKTYATYLLNNNIPLEVIARALGHSNTKITQAYYAKMQDNTVIESISSLY